VAAFNVNGTYLAMSATAQWTQPIGIAGVLSFVGHPATDDPGIKFAIDLLKETNSSEYEYTVRFGGGLRLGGAGGPPTLGVEGEIVKGGVSWVELRTLEEWQPIPVLLVPRLNGSLLFYEDGLTKVDVAAATDRWVIIPDVLEWRDVLVTVDVEPFYPANYSGTPAMLVDAAGGLLVGGSNGFYATVRGQLDTAVPSAISEPRRWLVAIARDDQVLCNAAV
jgi:hypothetical protein